MSRSYRKKPILKDGGNSSKKEKRKANQSVRRKYSEIDFPKKGNYYRRLYPQWDINDWISFWTLEEAIKDYETDKYGYWHEKYKTLDSFIAYWYKTMKRK